MSHIVVAKTKVKNPNRNIAKRAFELVVKEYNGKILKTNREWDRYVEVQGDILARIGNRVIGINVGDTLEVVGDPFGWEEEFEEIKKEIEKTYIALAVMVAMESENYTLSEVNKEKKAVVMAFIKE